MPIPEITTPLIKQVMAHEGWSGTVYRCPAGKRTIGYGHNLDADPYHMGSPIPETISRELGIEILIQDLQRTARELYRRCREFADAEPGPRQDVLINMAFNVGVIGLLEFKKMLASFDAQDWDHAAAEMYRSKWHKQVKSRAAELETQMRTGVYAGAYAS